MLLDAEATWHLHPAAMQVVIIVSGRWRMADGLNTQDLAVNGTDLIAAGVPEGPAIGRLLNNLLEAVIAGEAANEKQALLSRAADLAAAVRTAEKTTD